MADLIDRQAAIDALWKIKDERDSVYYTSAIHSAVDALSELPSAEPERKTGRWIESDTDGFVCSECRNGYRNQPTLMGKPMFEYCPVCGAKMEVEHD